MTRVSNWSINSVFNIVKNLTIVYVKLRSMYRSAWLIYLLYIYGKPHGNSCLWINKVNSCKVGYKHMFLSLAVFFSIYFYISFLALFLSIYPYISFSHCLSLSISIFLSLTISLYISFTHRFFFLSFYFFLSLYLSLS